jgi:hypothetical protein
MPVNNVNSSEGARIDQLQAQKSAGDTQLIRQQQRQDDEAASREVGRVTEEGRGENMDITV